MRVDNGYEQEEICNELSEKVNVSTKNSALSALLSCNIVLRQYSEDAKELAKGSRMLEIIEIHDHINNK